MSGSGSFQHDSFITSGAVDGLGELDVEEVMYRKHSVETGNVEEFGAEETRNI